MNVRVIGKCSLCGGRVGVPVHWAGVRRPVPRCGSCGATAQDGPVIEMERLFAVPAPEQAPLVKGAR